MDRNESSGMQGLRRMDRCRDLRIKSSKKGKGGGVLCDRIEKNDNEVNFREAQTGDPWVSAREQDQGITK